MKNRNWAQPQFTEKTRPNSLFQIPPPIRAWSSRRLEPELVGWTPSLSHFAATSEAGLLGTRGSHIQLALGKDWDGTAPRGPELEYLASICWGDLYGGPSLAAGKRNMRQRRDGKVSDVSSEYSQHSGPGRGSRHFSQEMIIIQPAGIHEVLLTLVPALC